MVNTKYGYLHGHYGPDMDGSSRTFEWVESFPQPEAERDVVQMPGWFAKCEVEPEAGLVGPFETEEEAIRVATDYHSFMTWLVETQYGDDPLGDHHGRNV